LLTILNSGASQSWKNWNLTVVERHVPGSKGSKKQNTCPNQNPVKQQSYQKIIWRFVLLALEQSISSSSPMFTISTIWRRLVPNQQRFPAENLLRRAEGTQWADVKPHSAPGRNKSPHRIQLSTSLECVWLLLNLEPV
jgi:hypothetical protein